jgi:hypothetical protein
MRIERIIYSVLIIVVTAIACVNWRKATLFKSDNEELRSRIEALEGEMQATEVMTDRAQSNSVKIRAQTVELMQLRNEVTQLRSGNKAIEKLAAENTALKTQVAQAKSAGAAAQDQPIPSENIFRRESWTFAGYASPESALVSAIWAMREGDPATYLNSLAPHEQERIAKLWQDKTETEIAEKHKKDVAAISQFAVMETRQVSPTEIVMSVYIGEQGRGRTEQVRMNQIGQEWKFGGFIREAQSPAPNSPGSTATTAAQP